MAVSAVCRRICAFGALVLLFSAPAGFAPEGGAAAVSAQSAILTDESGTELFSRLPDKRLPMASLTKLMTGILALERGNPDSVITVKRSHTLAEGTRMYLREGEKLSLEDLIYGLLLSSGNDAALAIAEHIAGTVPAFVALMNERAAELGMGDTGFTNPSGLPDGNHFSTARDIAALMRHCMQNAAFAKITGTREAVRAGRTIVNHNRLLSACPGVDGGKTGFTKSAGRCLATTAERKGRRLFAVTLNAPSDWNDHKGLYDSGFSIFSEYTLCENGVFEPRGLTLVGGRQESVLLYIDKTVTVWLSGEEYAGLETILRLRRFEYAPVSKGMRAGELVFAISGRELTRAELYCLESVEYDDGRAAAHPLRIGAGAERHFWRAL